LKKTYTSEAQTDILVFYSGISVDFRMPSAPTREPLGDAVEPTDLLRDFELTSEEPLASQVYQILRDEIISMRLIPGQLISEKEIAEVLKASKTPVREALIRLEIDGLVNIVPKSGTYVSPIRINKYIEACFTRLQLEIGAVRRAANPNVDPAQIDELDISHCTAGSLRLQDCQGFGS